MFFLPWHCDNTHLCAFIDVVTAANGYFSLIKSYGSSLAVLRFSHSILKSSVVRLIFVLCFLMTLSIVKTGLTRKTYIKCIMIDLKYYIVHFVFLLINRKRPILCLKK